MRLANIILTYVQGLSEHVIHVSEHWNKGFEVNDSGKFCLFFERNLGPGQILDTSFSTFWFYKYNFTRLNSVSSWCFDQLFQIFLAPKSKLIFSLTFLTIFIFLFFFPASGSRANQAGLNCVRANKLCKQSFLDSK